jgi:hypothetical protein
MDASMRKVPQLLEHRRGNPGQISAPNPRAVSRRRDWGDWRAESATAPTHDEPVGVHSQRPTWEAL